MKKLLVAAVAAVMTTGAFADHHGTKHMVRAYGFTDAGNSSSIDFSMSGDDTENAEEKVQNIALNYAYAINSNWQVGLTYKSYSKTTDGDVASVGDKSNTIGLDGYYNMGEKLTSSCYVGLHYHMTTNDDNDATEDSGNKATTIGLEYGHRFEVGHAWGMHLTFSPSLTYNMTTTAPNADGADDVNSTALAWNFVKFDVLF